MGFDSIPQQIERKLLTRGFTFNLMLVGSSGLGKSTFVNTLFASKILPRNNGLKLDELKKTVELTTRSHGLIIVGFVNFKVIEENGVQLKLSVTDTPGFGDQIDNDQW